MSEQCSVVFVSQHLCLLLCQLGVTALEELVVTFTALELLAQHEEDEAQGDSHHHADDDSGVDHRVVVVWLERIEKRLSFSYIPFSNGHIKYQ